LSQQSVGSLKKDIDGNCLPVNIGGTYVQGQNAGDSNYMLVEVSVTTTGKYSITTDTINGYSFKATGNFNVAGSVQVKLACFGTPVTKEIDNFTVKYNESVCEAVVIVHSNTVEPAVFTLAGAPGVCMNDTVLGSYVKNVSLDTSAKVKISVDVTVPGSYNITTNALNGYSFAASGLFTVTGVQTVELAASGQPANTGTNVFTVTAGSSACNFSVVVLDAIVVTNDNHFPLTDNSYWVYDDLLHPGDSIKRTVSSNTTTNGFTYKAMQEDKRFTNPLPYLFRYSAPDLVYYEYTNVEKYTRSFQYNKDVKRDLPFLKENLSTGDNWESAEFVDTATFGQVIFLKYDYRCTDANATVTINGKAFTNVYKISLTSQIRTTNNPYGPTGDEYTFYYAKGVGLIYMKFTVTGFLNEKCKSETGM
jgi:hypothetical protein